jgi:hypothetical protein
MWSVIYCSANNQSLQSPQEGISLACTLLLKQVVKSSFQPILTAKGKELYPEALCDFIAQVVANRVKCIQHRVQSLRDADNKREHTPSFYLACRMCLIQTLLLLWSIRLDNGSMVSKQVVHKRCPAKPKEFKLHECMQQCMWVPVHRFAER